jgi:riboflavin biosynthesis pyrimidine reductase
VLANMVAGLDGSAAVAGRVGELSGPVDQALFRRLRSVADVVLVGAETVRREHYGPVRIDDERRAERVAAGREPVPGLAIVTRSLRLDLASRAFTEAERRTVVVTCEAADPARRAALAEIADVVVAGDERVDMSTALQMLSGDVVLCEGGPALLGELVDGGLLDELCLTLSPLMGGDPLPVAVSLGQRRLTRFRLAHALANGSTLFLRYEREWRAPTSTT